MKYLLFLTFSLLLNCSLFAQIANYNLNSNLLDPVGGFDAIANGDPQFIGDGGAQVLSLDGDDYLMLPSSLLNEIDLVDGFQYALRFKITDTHVDNPFNGETGAGTRVIISSKYRDQREAGFELYVEDWDGDYRLNATYSDGIPVNEVLPSGQIDFLDILEVDVWYEISANMVFDTPNPYVRYVLNNSVINSFFDPGSLNVEGFKNTLTTQDIYVGTDRENDLENWTGPFAEMSLDYLTLFSPPLPGDASRVNSVLTTLIDQMNGTLSLTENQEDLLYNDFIINWDNNSYAPNEAIVLDYLSTFDNAEGTVFEAEDFVTTVGDLPVKKRIQFIIEQWMLDNLYTSANIANMESISFLDHVLFPGLVDAAAPRSIAASVTVDGDYNTDPGFMLNDQGYVIRPTGYYAAAGELVTFQFPANAINSGLKARIGAHFVNLATTQTSFKRFPRMGVELDIDNTSISVVNPFGGAIYIILPDGTNLGALSFQIDGAVKMPYYCTKPGFETALSDYQQDLNNNYTVWTDWESADFMITFPSATALLESDPTAALDLWDQSMNAYNLITGRPVDRFRSEYLLIERQNHNAFTVPASYPMSLESGNFSEPNTVQPPLNILDEETFMEDYGVTTIFHEWGHLHNMPTLSNEVETNVELPSAVVFNEVFGVDFNEALQLSTNSGLDRNSAALDWILTPPFRLAHRIHLDTFNYPEENSPYANQLPYQARGYAKYVDIGAIFSWDTLGLINGHFYNEGLMDPNFDPYQIEDDEYIEVASQELGVNMAPLFEFWGILPSDDLVASLEAFPDEARIEERLLHYRSIVPLDNAAFQTVYNTTTATIEEYHAIRYDNMLLSYDESVADSILRQIDYILCKYFDTNCTYPAVDLELKVFLEGPTIDGNGNMRTDLVADDLIPLEQPYNVAPYNYMDQISATTIPNDVVDWVLLEARSGTASITGTGQTVLVEQALGFLKSNGDISNITGTGGVRFTQLDPTMTYHFVVRHRNHLDVMSAVKLAASNNPISYDFTIGEGQAFGNDQLKEDPVSGAYMLFAGDYNGDGVIQTTDFDEWMVSPSILNSYQNTDGNLDGTVQVTDFDQWFPNKAKLGAVEIRY